MSDMTRSQLEQAYRLIQQEELDQAIAILRPITASQPNNVDAWWLLANAVSEPEDANDALSNVLRLVPNHVQARNLLNQLQDQFPELRTASPAPSNDYGYGDPFASAPAPAASSDFGDTDISNLFGDQPSSSSFGSSDFGTSDFGSSDFDATSAPAMDQDLGRFFDSSAEPSSVSFGDDPFGSSDPQFVNAGVLDEAQEAPKKKGRFGRGPKEPKEDKPKKRTDKDFIKEEDVKPAANDPLVIEERVNKRPSPALLIASVLLLVIVLGGAAAILLATGTIKLGGGPAPTEVAAGVTSTAGAETPAAGGTAAPTSASGTATVAPTAGTGGTTNADLGGALQTVESQFGSSNFQKAQAQVVQSSVGDTLQVQICDAAGPSLQDRVNQAMDLLAQEAAKVRASVKGAAVQVVSCAKPDVKLFRAVASIDDIARYVDSGMTDKATFQASWKRS